MEINTHNAEILLSAANKSHYPQDELPEIALAGRSNVGKSSFINTMLNRKNLARTSGKPGKTQLLNFFNIDDKMRFVDVPGYGYEYMIILPAIDIIDGKPVRLYQGSYEKVREVAKDVFEAYPLTCNGWTCNLLQAFSVS